MKKIIKIILFLAFVFSIAPVTLLANNKIKIGKKYVFDSLPNGQYVLQYTDIKQDTFTKRINLKNNNSIIPTKKKIIQRIR